MAARRDKILDKPFYYGDLNKEITLREIFKAYLIALWEESERFSGKRPLGNSGWQIDIAMGLTQVGLLVSGKIDKDGEWVDFDSSELDDLIISAIRRL